MPVDVLVRYAKKFDLHSVSVGVWPKNLGTPHAYTAYVHFKDPDGTYTLGECVSGWGQTMEAAICKAIEERKGNGLS